MGSMLSAGVRAIETDLSVIVPAVSTSIGVFAGLFEKGYLGTYQLVTSEDDLIEYFGKPTNENYNDWFQARNFLLYGNTLLISRALDENGTLVSSGAKVSEAIAKGETTIKVNLPTKFKVGQKIAFNGDREKIYQIETITLNEITLDKALETNLPVDSTIEYFDVALNAFAECKHTTTKYTDDELRGLARLVRNPKEFEEISTFIPFASSDSKFKFIAKYPGKYGNRIKIGIAVPEDFKNGKSEVIKGVMLNSLFQRDPVGSEIAIIVIDDKEIVETFIVSTEIGAKDYQGKSIFIEDVINRKSKYVYVLNNEQNTNKPTSFLYNISRTDSNGVTTNSSTTHNNPNDEYEGLLELKFGNDGQPNSGDIERAYDVFSNKEELDIDIVIANENAHLAAANLAMKREDCVTYVGAKFEHVVGRKSADIVAACVDYVNNPSSEFNLNTSYVAFFANYAQVYDKYNDTFRWVNIAGLMGGLRAQTNDRVGEHAASAGLINGVLKGIVKLYFSPNNGQRDILYKSRCNPVVSFAGMGSCAWGQKTLLGYASAFDRINVRTTFNKLKRAISKMALAYCFDTNTEFTRQRFKATISPILRQDKGVQEFYIDLSKNTPEVIARNEFVVNILIKPTYTMEFITLNFVAVGPSISFKEAVANL